MTETDIYGGYRIAESPEEGLVVMFNLRTPAAMTSMEWTLLRGTRRVTTYKDEIMLTEGALERRIEKLRSQGLATAFSEAALTALCQAILTPEAKIDGYADVHRSTCSGGVLSRLLHLLNG